MSARLKKKRDIAESRYGQTFSPRSYSRVLEQVDDQRMRDGKGVHTIREIHVIAGRRVQRRR